MGKGSVFELEAHAGDQLFIRLPVVSDTGLPGEGRRATGAELWTELTSASCQFQNQRF